MNTLEQLRAGMTQLPELPCAIAMSSRTIDLLFVELQSPPTEEVTCFGIKIVADESLPVGEYRWRYR